jgi:hypothetical protein
MIEEGEIKSGEEMEVDKPEGTHGVMGLVSLLAI